MISCELIVKPTKEKNTTAIALNFFPHLSLAGSPAPLKREPRFQTYGVLRTLTFV